MADEVNVTPTGAAEQTTEEVQTGNNLGNSDVAGHPKFQAVMKELSELKRAEAERRQKAETAKREAEIKKAEEEKRFDDVLKLKEAEFEKTKADYEHKLLSGSLTNELLKAGFGHDVFIRGAIACYDKDTHGDVTAYVASLAADELNKAFITGQASRTPQTPPLGANVTGANKVDWAQVKADYEIPVTDQSAEARLKRANARKKISEEKERTGKYPF